MDKYKLQTEYDKRQDKAGIIKVCVRIPATERDRLKKYAARLRKEKL